MPPECHKGDVSRASLSGMRRRAVLVVAAVGIATVAVNVMGVKSISPGTVVTTRASNPAASTTPTTTPTMRPVPLTPAPPYPVEQATFSLVDPSRDTPARGDVPGHGGRSLL